MNKLLGSTAYVGQLIRIIVHWTGGAGRASAEDKASYHGLVEFDGNMVKGKEDPQDNIVTGDDDYARHTLRLNTGSIGLALCGMGGAIEQPFDAGRWPITEAQFRAACIWVAYLCRQHGIPVTPETVLTHAEVEPTLGVKQKGKWDIARLPWRSDLRGARAVGDHMRALVREALGIMQPASFVDLPVLKLGSRGPLVREVQERLRDLGYYPGAIDSIYGTATRAAVVEFQTDRGITIDGETGPQTRGAMGVAEKRGETNPLAEARADTTVKDMRAKGSETIAAADRAQAGVGGAVVVAGGGALLDSLTADPVGTITDVAGKVDQVGSLPVVARLAAWAADNWWIILAGIAALYGLAYMQRVKERRLADHQSGANRGR